MPTPFSLDLSDTLTLILAGGKGSRLEPLTTDRAKPAVPFGGVYRIIDFTLSNCIHSGLRRVYVLTQYQARSLEEHIRFGWNFLPRRLEQFISVRPPHHRREERWYQGTADAIYQNLATIVDERPKRVLVLSGDHIYKMDYREMLREHLEHEAALTIGAVRIPVAESPRFGIFSVDPHQRVVAFDEKPPRGREIPGEPGYCLGSMGIYVFETEELIQRLQADAADPNSSHDFGKNIIPAMIKESKVYAHAFRDVDGSHTPYWRDVGTIDAFFDAHMDLCGPLPQLNLHDLNWPIYSLWHNDPPAKTIFSGDQSKVAKVSDSMLSPGVVVSGGSVYRSVLSNRVHVAEGALVEDSILFSGVQVHPGAKVRKAILDKWAEVPSDMTIGYDLEEDAKRFHVTSSGIVVVPRKARFKPQLVH
ncbi:MAG: glucose-1-phosphate adenylyltransferase [Planctomycetota bacterium]|nr:MAG: glucose-1-phosphate adenylyltransferase [Planctomycetota bacterium]